MMKKYQGRSGKAGRIEFFDMAKGIGIIMIVLLHSGLPVPYVNICVCIFFLISGYFFKKGDTVSSIIKKVNTLLIPAFVFNLIIDISAHIHKTYFLDTESGFKIVGTLLMTNAQYTVIWFLLALFFDFIALLFLSKIIKNKYLIITPIILLVLLAGLAEGIPNLLSWRSALFSLPFFYLGYLFKTLDFFNYKIFDNIYVVVVAVAVFFAIDYIYSFVLKYEFYLFYPRYTGSLVLGYFVIMVEVVCVLVVIMKIPPIRVITYLGEFSIIVFCIHKVYIMMVMDVYTVVGITPTNYLTGFTTLALCAASIPLLNTYCPYIFGKKPLVPYPSFERKS